MTACVLGIGHYALQKHLEDTAGFLVDETTDALHTTPTGKTTDRGHGNAYAGTQTHPPFYIGRGGYIMADGSGYETR